MPRVKKCITCKQEIPEPRPFRKTCSPKCLIEYARSQEKKKRRKEKRLWIDANKTQGDLLREAQTECNAYIRARDAGKPCISCGKNSGAKMNAGHYKSVGSSPELRFHPFNINLQCEWCNSYLSGNQAKYREGLIEKIGIKNVEWLEGPHQAQNWTHDEIRAIKQTYKDKTKAIKGKV